MSNFRKFDYEDISELEKHAGENDLFLPIEKEVSALSRPLSITDKLSAPNAICVNPMEGHDADADGGPSALTFRRYRRFAKGGSGLIWVEATAVNESGKAHPRQLHINDRSVSGFSELVKKIKKAAIVDSNKSKKPVVVLQLTHSGRQSAPNGYPEPVIAKHSKLLDDNSSISPEYPVISDEQLDELKQDFLRAAKLAQDAGFDSVDLKACHGYLLHELLISYNVEGSRYRGGFDERTKFVLGAMREVNNKVPELTLATRLDIYDNIPYPDGWGVRNDGGIDPDLSELKRLLELMVESGLELFNTAFGNPYYDPFLERPYDRPLVGEKAPDIHPLEAISTNLSLTAEIGENFPHLTRIGGGISWLREYFPHVATAMIKRGWIDGIGLGRIALSNPNFANEVMQNGKLNRDDLCISCSSCSQMMVDGVESGCPIHDGEMYMPAYLKGRQKAKFLD